MGWGGRDAQALAPDFLSEACVVWGRWERVGEGDADDRGGGGCGDCAIVGDWFSGLSEGATLHAKREELQLVHVDQAAFGHCGPGAQAGELNEAGQIRVKQAAVV